MLSPRKNLKWLFLIWGIFLLPDSSVYTQHPSHDITLAGNLLSNSRIYVSPQSSDPVLRQASVTMDPAWSAALMYRLELVPSVLLRFRGEYLSASRELHDRHGTRSIDGYDAAAFESSAMFALPIASKRVRVCVGGGIGLYVAQRRLSIAGVVASSSASTAAVDIHVLLSGECFLLRTFSLRAEVLFRDPHISVQNAFPIPEVVSNGIPYHLNTEAFRSTINLNGNVYSVGLSWYF